MIGRKIYYNIDTGDEILTTPEKHSDKASETTKEQDFMMYEILSVRNPEQVGYIQLNYGEYRTEFEKSSTVKVDLETLEPIFSYPEFEPSPAERVYQLEVSNQGLRNDTASLTLELAQEQFKTQSLQKDVADLTMQLASKGVI